MFLHSLVRYGSVAPITALALTGAPAAPGDLDPAFGMNGKVTTDFEGRFDEGRGMAIQPDGRIVVAGEMIRTVNPQDPPQTGDRNFAVVRYLANGTLDKSFGVGGRVFTDFGQDFELAFDMALQADGKIVAAGESGTLAAGGNFDFAVARYNTDGSLDTSFSGDGRVTIDFGGDDDAARNVTLQLDGKVVVAGYSGNESDEDSYDFAVARYNTDGTLDTSFSGDGTVKTDFAGSGDSAFAVATQPNGRILVAGSATGPDPGDFAVVRYSADGSLDGSFGSGGKVFTDFGGGYDEIDALALRPDGTFVVAGGSGVSEDPAPGGAFALARYLPNGKLDTAFGSGGTVETEFTGGLDHAFGLALQADGKIIAAGVADQFVDPIGRGDFALTRYQANGSLDSSFGTYGKVTTDFEGAFDNARDVAVQRDGKIVVAGEGTHPNSTSRDIAVARYIAR